MNPPNFGGATNALRLRSALPLLALLLASPAAALVAPDVVPPAPAHPGAAAPT